MQKTKILKHTLRFKHNKIAIMIASFCVVLIFVLAFNTKSIVSFYKKIFANYTTEVKEVSATSPGYDTTPGSIKITKKTDWISHGVAELEIELETTPVFRTKPRDVIFLLDTSVSLNGEKDGGTFSGLKKATNSILENTNNRVALVSFNSVYNIEQSFTNNASVMDTTLKNLHYGNETSYYQGLRGVEALLNNYTYTTSRDLQLIIITDGYALNNIGLDEAQYQALRSHYPTMEVIGVQENEGGTANVTRVSEKQIFGSYYCSSYECLIVEASDNSEFYKSFLFEENIDTTYFNIVSSSVTKGTSTSSANKISWNLANNRFKSGGKAKLTIRLQVKDQYKETKGYFGTSLSSLVNFSTESNKTLNYTTSITPVLKSFYNVKYSINAPKGCSATFAQSEDYFPFDIANIIDTKPGACSGYVFKGWQVKEDDVKITGATQFELPTHDVNIYGTWTQLSINKKVDGTISTRSTLYEQLASTSVLDSLTSNTSTPYTSTNGLYMAKYTQTNKKPILYYRGNVTNNNLIFGNFCWKIVRTTDSGGIKLIYNGTPYNGTCTRTGTATTIGQSQWVTEESLTNNRLASLGESVSYMYGPVYPTQSWNISEEKWPEILGLPLYYTTTAINPNPVYFANSYIAYNATNGNQGYKLSGTLSKSMVNNAANVGKYTMRSETNESTSYWYTLGYVISTDNEGMYFTRFSRDDYANSGNSTNIGPYYKNKALNTLWYYGNDVTYSNGVYTLVNAVQKKPLNVANNVLEEINNDKYYHYYCMTGTATCSEVYYYFSYSEEYGNMGYIKLTNGKKIENAVNEMLGANSANSSTVKTKIDQWYATNMTSYTYMLEDAVWCNSRKEDMESGWYKDKSYDEFMVFDDYFNQCDSEDSYTVNKTNGNGALTYPVGLITASETMYAGANYFSNYYLLNGLKNWTMSPNYHNNIIGYVNVIKPDGEVDADYEATTTSSDRLRVQEYIRPMVSLKPGVYLADGDGTATNPYKIEME